MTDPQRDSAPHRPQKQPQGSGSWIPLLGSAAILAVMLGLVIVLAATGGG